MIQFSTIPNSLLKPGEYIELNNRLARNALPANPQKVLLVFQKLKDAVTWVTLTAYTAGTIAKPVTANGHIYFCITAGTTAAGEPSWPTTVGGEVTDGTAVWKEIGSDSVLTAQLVVKQLFADSEAKTYWGDGSMGHVMTRAALAANKYVQLFGIAIDDAAGVHASQTVTVSGAPGGSGFIRVWIDDEPVEIPFVSTDTPTTLAAALKAAVAVKSYLPVVGKSAAGVLTLIYKHSGTAGNCTRLKVEFTPSGSLNVAAGAATFASGTTDPNISSAGSLLDKIFPTRYNLIASAWNDSTNAGKLKTHIVNVSSALEERPGKVVIGMVDSVANVQTLTDTVNSERVVVIAVKGGYSSPMSMAAGVASILGYKEDPALPVDGWPVKNIMVIDEADRYSRTEIETLLANGVTPMEYVDGYMTIVRAVTTYQTDLSYLDISSIDILDYYRDAEVAMVKGKYRGTKFPESKIPILEEDLVAVAKKLEEAEILQKIDENRAEFRAEIGSTPGRVNAKLPAHVVPGLHVFAARIDLFI
jgi:phage tail sheath gpL-like